MVTKRAHNLWVPGITLLIAFMLSAFPLLEWVQWGWPKWVLVVFIYWVIALPHRFGLGWAFILGLLLDLLQGNYLGVNALAMVVVTFLLCSCTGVYACIVFGNRPLWCFF